jgi:hypothetical protein
VPANTLVIMEATNVKVVPKASRADFVLAYQI